MKHYIKDLLIEVKGKKISIFSKTAQPVFCQENSVSMDYQG